jgi:hypothetical protein
VFEVNGQPRTGSLTDTGVMTASTFLGNGDNTLLVCARSLSGTMGCTTWQIIVDTTIPEFLRLNRPAETYNSQRFTTNATPIIDFEFVEPVNISGVAINGSFLTDFEVRNNGRRCRKVPNAKSWGA